MTVQAMQRRSGSDHAKQGPNLCRFGIADPKRIDEIAHQNRFKTHQADTPGCKKRQRKGFVAKLPPQNAEKKG